MEKRRCLMIMFLIVVVCASAFKCWDVKYTVKELLVIDEENTELSVTHEHIDSEYFDPKLVLGITIIECGLIIFTVKKRFMFLGLVADCVKFIIPFSRFSVEKELSTISGKIVEENISHYYFSFYIVVAFTGVLCVLYILEMCKKNKEKGGQQNCNHLNIYTE